MSPTTIGLILLSVTLSALAQISMKLGMSSPEVQQAISSSGAGVLYAIASSPAVLLGLALYGLGAFSWVFVLAKVDVTQAYPFVGLSFVLTLALGYFLLSEPVTALRIGGVALVIAGIGLIAQS